VELTNRFLQLIAIRPTSEQDRTTAQLMLANAQERLQNSAAAVDLARAALAREPLNPIAYRSAASALLSARRADDAAVTLMTGFMITGQLEMRTAMIELYRAGLDTEGCAFRQTPNGPVLNEGCALVKRHLCAASAEAIRIHRAAGRADLAAQIEQTTGAGCQ
jgi:hypothetical protein